MPGITLGDGVVAEFPTAHAALAAALDGASRARELVLDVRFGVHAGTVARERTEVFGTALNVASRVCDLAESTAVLASQAVINRLEDDTRFEITDAGNYLLKGVDGTVTVHRVDTAH